MLGGLRPSPADGFRGRICGLTLALSLVTAVSHAQLPSSDLNGDGIVDISDAIALVQEGLDPGTDPDRVDELDLNQNGYIDGMDGEMLLGAVLGREFTFPVDLDVAEPADGLTYTNQNIITIRGSVAETADVAAGLEKFEGITGEFESTFFLEDGLNQINVEAKRPGELEVIATQSRAVILDLAPPSLSVLDPGNQALIMTETVEVTGVAVDSSPVTVTISTPMGTQEAEPDPFGEYAAEIGLTEGQNEIIVTATDAAGNENRVTIEVHSYLSPEQMIESEGGAFAMLPEGALDAPDMAVRIDDADNTELNAIFGNPTVESDGFALLSDMPPGGMDGLTEGVIIMPGAIMMEIENPPLNGSKLFQKDIDIGIPNETGADASMPLWIFQIQPDMDGDGEPQLCIVSRATVSEDGSMIIPVKDGGTMLDDMLTGVDSEMNVRFDEDELGQVAAARSVQNLLARLQGTIEPELTGKNIARAMPVPYLGPGKPDPVNPPKEMALAGDASGSLLLPKAAFTSGWSELTPEFSRRGVFLQLLVDNYEDGDLFNLLNPPGISYVADANEDDPHPNDPIRPKPLEETHLPDEGNPPKRIPEPNGVNGGIHVNGSFGPADEQHKFSIFTSFLGQKNVLNVSLVEELVFEFDAKSVASQKDDIFYEVTLWDSGGPGLYLEFEPTRDWQTYTFAVGEFSSDPAALTRVEWRIRGDTGANQKIDLSIDQPLFRGRGDAIPTPTPYLTPTATPIEEPTPTPAVTETPPPPVTATPRPPRPTTGGDIVREQIPDEPTPIPSAGDPEDGPPQTGDEGDDGGTTQNKTQVTFYCCAASAVIPYVGETGCDDDENVDQQRLRECITEAMIAWLRCERDLAKMLGDLDRLVDAMEKGYDTMFGRKTIAGKKVTTIVCGSVFGSVPFGFGKGGGKYGKAAEALAGDLGSLGDALTAVSEVERAVQATTTEEKVQAYSTAMVKAYKDYVSQMLGVSDELAERGANVPERLRYRKGFKDALGAAGFLKNVYDTYNSASAYIEGYYLADVNAEAAMLEMKRCSRLFQRFRDLKNCNKGSNAWEACFFEEGEGRIEVLAKRIEKHEKQLAILRGTMAAQRDAFQEIVSTIETMHEGALLAARAADLSVEIEENPGQFTEQELVDRMLESQRILEGGIQSFIAVVDNAEDFEDSVLAATEGLKAAQQGQQVARELSQTLEMFRELQETIESGDPGIVINLQGQSGVAGAMSRPGGTFVGYKFASAGRVGDAVTFTGGEASMNATLPKTLFGGGAPITFPDVTYPFIPGTRVDYDAVIEAGTVPLKVSTDDRLGIAPEVTLSVPGSTARGVGDLLVPPGSPFLLKAEANDDIAVFSTRFLINDEPTEALGTTDFPDNPNPITFQSYFLAPEDDTTGARGIQTLVIQAQAIDAGGNIGTSSSGQIIVDPDAEFLATINPSPGLGFENGPPIQFSATVTETGDPLPSPVWFVEGVLGGNDRVGTITQAGLYTPPGELQTISQSYRIQVVSNTQPELIGEGSAVITAVTQPVAIATVLNLIPGGDVIGRQASKPVSVMGLFAPAEGSGRQSSKPVSVMGLFAPAEGSGRQASGPVSVMGLFAPAEASGRSASDPVSLDNTP